MSLGGLVETLSRRPELSRGQPQLMNERRNGRRFVDVNSRPRQTEKRWVEVSPAEPWRPHRRGESVEGTFTGVITGKGDNGPYNRYVIEESTRSVSIAGTVLDALFASAAVQIGEQVKIEFDGFRESRAGREFRMFRMWVNRDDVSVQRPAPYALGQPIMRIVHTVPFPTYDGDGYSPREFMGSRNYYGFEDDPPDNRYGMSQRRFAPDMGGYDDGEDTRWSPCG